MITVKCTPDYNFYGNEIPTEWEISFEEAEMDVDEAALWLKNIFTMMGYLPSQIASIFHPELVKEWGYQEKECADHIN
jgi:hypothetical protein